MRRPAVFLLCAVLLLTSSSCRLFKKPEKTDLFTISKKAVTKWEHPVKEVFKKYVVKIKEIRIFDKSDRICFYVNFPYKLSHEYKNYFQSLVKETAKANEYGDFFLIDSSKKITIEVRCNRQKNAIQEVLYNRQSNYFSGVETLEKLEAYTAGQKGLVDYLVKNAPEIEGWAREIKNNNTGDADLDIYVEDKPDPYSDHLYEREYYTLYVGGSRGVRNINLGRFLVHKDTRQILWYSRTTGQYLTLDEWRKNIPALIIPTFSPNPSPSSSIKPGVSTSPSPTASIAVDPVETQDTNADVSPQPDPGIIISPNPGVSISPPEYPI